LLLKFICIRYTYLWVWLGWQNSIPISSKVLGWWNYRFVIFLILDSMFDDNCHKLGNIGKHPCALVATNILHPKYCELWFQMKNTHSVLLHAFHVALWVFLSIQGYASKLGLNLNDIIYLVPKKSVKLSKLNFFLLPVLLNWKKYGSEVLEIFL
jgi:hypothetical protein